MFEQIEMGLDYKDLWTIKIVLEQHIEGNVDKGFREECEDLLSRVNSEILKIKL